MVSSKSLALLWAAFVSCAAYRQKDQILNDLSREQEWAEPALRTNSSHKSSEVYVMLPLTVVTASGKVDNYQDLRSKLEKLKKAGTDGFMVDVWWGLTEKVPKVYDFGAYKQLVDLAENLGLKVQLVTSFHQCGGNVGDTCHIPLPAFVTNNTGVWYKEQGGRENKEYISLFADDVKLQDGRTPLEMYYDFMVSLATTFESKLGSTITEIQVGMGPCGELRYPSYPLAYGWDYCGVGEFQCWDQHALESLKVAGAAKLASMPEDERWGEPTLPPSDAGSYNSRPHHDFFFSNGYHTDYGKFFLDWYSGALKTHGAKVLQKAKAAFRGKVHLAGKVAGIHWWYHTNSHAAELTAGYYNTNHRDAYYEIAKTFRDSGASALDFTCLEMQDPHHGNECHSAPASLVHQVIKATQRAGLHFNGENALPSHHWYQYDTILKKHPHISAFTYLRLDDQLVSDNHEGIVNFRRFVEHMHR